MYNETKKKEYLETLDNEIRESFVTYVFNKIESYEENIDLDIAFMDSFEIKELMKKEIMCCATRFSYIKELKDYIKWMGQEQYNYLTTSKVYDEKFDFVTEKQIFDIMKQVSESLLSEDTAQYDIVWIGLLFYCGNHIETIADIRLSDFVKQENGKFLLRLRDNLDDEVTREVIIPNKLYKECEKLASIDAPKDSLGKKYNIIRKYQDSLFYIRSDKNCTKNIYEKITINIAENIKRNRRKMLKSLNIVNCRSINDIVIGGFLYATKKEIIKSGVDYDINAKRVNSYVAEIINKEIEFFGLSGRYQKYSQMLKSYMKNY